jgi:hypothetical protein
VPHGKSLTFDWFLIHWKLEKEKHGKVKEAETGPEMKMQTLDMEVRIM